MPDVPIPPLATGSRRGRAPGGVGCQLGQPSLFQQGVWDGNRDAIRIDSNPRLRIPSNLIASRFPTPRQSEGGAALWTGDGRPPRSTRPVSFPSFLRNAFQGYFHMPRRGTENINRLLFAPDRSLVAMDLGAVLPERT